MPTLKVTFLNVQQNNSKLHWFCRKNYWNNVERQEVLHQSADNKRQQNFNYEQLMNKAAHWKQRMMPHWTDTLPIRQQTVSWLVSSTVDRDADQIKLNRQKTSPYGKSDDYLGYFRSSVIDARGGFGIHTWSSLVGQASISTRIRPLCRKNPRGGTSSKTAVKNVSGAIGLNGLPGTIRDWLSSTDGLTFEAFIYQTGTIALWELVY